MIKMNYTVPPIFNETEQNYTVPPLPTPGPTLGPTLILDPTGAPTFIPTGVPTLKPTGIPTLKPTGTPTGTTTGTPTTGLELTEAKDYTWVWSFSVIIIPALIVACLTKPGIIKGWISNIKSCFGCSKSETSDPDSDSV